MPIEPDPNEPPIEAPPPAPPPEEPDPVVEPTPPPPHVPLTVEINGIHLGIRLQPTEDDLPFRRVLTPGSIVQGVWQATDISGEDQTIQDAATEAWTTEAVAAYRTEAEQQWADMQPPPPSTDPEDWPLSIFQFEGMLLTMGVTFADIETAINAMDMTATEKAFAISRLRNATSYNRGHPLVAALMPAFGLSAGDVDAAWMAAKDVH